MPLDPSRDFTKYLSYDRAQLKLRLSRILTSLAGAWEDYYFTKSTMSRNWADAYESSPEPTTTGRERDAKLRVRDLDDELFAIDGLIHSLEIERDFIHFLLKETILHVE